MTRIAWRRMEREARHHLRPLLRDYLRLTRTAHSLLEEAARAFGSPNSGYRLTRSGQVQVRLLVRMSHDLRALTLAAESGYSVQALSQLANIYELACAIAYIGSDESRAREWEEHESLTETYPASRKKAVKELLQTVFENEPIPDAKLAHMVQEQERLYTLACVAKHSNPRILKDLGVAISGDSMRIFHGPFADVRSIKQARFSLFHGARMLISATALFAKPILKVGKDTRTLVKRTDTALNQLIQVMSQPVGHGLEAAQPAHAPAEARSV